MRCNACNLYFSMCVLKLRLSSIVIPNRITSWDFSSLYPSRDRFTLMSVFVPNIMNWNLSGFIFNEFTLNHFKMCPKSNLKLCNNHLTFSHKNLLCYLQQNYIYRILRQQRNDLEPRTTKDLELILVVSHKLNPTSHWRWNLFLSFVSDYLGILL